MAFQIFMFLNNLKPLFLLSIILVLLQSCSCANSSLSCRQEERDALIRFGKTMDPSFNSSESFEQDCCVWSWITCDAVTRHVVKLELYPSNETHVSPFPPDGIFATNMLDISSLLQLKFLNHLNLRGLFLDGPNCQIPEFIGSMKRLKFLDLSGVGFSGRVPPHLGNLTNLPTLQYLDLSENYLQGKIPSAIQNMTSLTYLDMSFNQFNSSVPSWFGGFANLQHLNLSWNSFESVLPSSLPANLKELDLSNNLLIGPIPSYLGNLSVLRMLDLSLNMLGGPIPSSLGNLSVLTTLHLSGNFLSGYIPSSIGIVQSLTKLNLGNNCFIGGINMIQLSRLEYLDISQNYMREPIPYDIGRNMPQLSYLLLNDNNISGLIPPSLCDMFNLKGLDLSNNALTRNIPDCWLRESSSLVVINLSSNNLTGVIPSSIMNLSALQSVHLNKNNLHGELPEALRFLDGLVILDLGENNLSGDVPPWIGESLSSLQILRLRDNKLNGTIPHQLCGLSGLQILDLAGNDLEGEIPSCKEKMTEVSKGREMEYTSNLQYVITLDLSRNKLIGSVPEDVTLLNSLDCLNLSYNALSGSIPEKIGNLKVLVSLDLSNNQLSRTIPHSISDLLMLSHLNMANNRLSGRIPKGSQLDTIYDSDHSIYDGNPQLCGEPLPICPGDKFPLSPYMPSKHDEDVLEQVMFYVSVILGFGTGLWGVVLTLMFKKSWRAAYFKFADDIVDKVFVVVKVKVNKLKRSRRTSIG